MNVELFRFLNMEMNLPKPEARILTYLIDVNDYVDVRKIHENVTKDSEWNISERKIYEYLNSLVDQGFVVSEKCFVVSKKRYVKCFKAKSIDIILNTLVTHKRIRLTEQIERIEEEAMRLRRALPRVTMSGKVSPLPSPADLYGCFCDSIERLEKNEEVLVETASSLIWSVPEYEFEAMSRDNLYREYAQNFKKLFYRRLSGGKIVAKYVCKLDAFAQDIDSEKKLHHRIRRLEALKNNVIKLSPNLQIVNVNELLFGLPATTIFGDERVILSFKEYSSDKLKEYSSGRLVGGVLIESEGVVRMFKEYFNKYFVSHMYKNLKDYFTWSKNNSAVEDLTENEKINYQKDYILKYIDMLLQHLNSVKI